MIENVYTLKLINKTQHDHDFKVSVTGIEGISMSIDKEIISIATGEVITTAVRLTVDPYSLKERSVPIDFHMQAVDDKTLKVIEDAKFLGPFRK